MGRFGFFAQSELPPALKDDVEKNRLVREMRAGSESAYSALVRGHMRLSAYLAGRHIKKYPQQRDDLIGTAFCELCKAVRDFKYKPEHSDITAYITSTVNGRLQDLIEDLPVVRVPRSSHNTGVEYIQPTFTCAEDAESKEDPGFQVWEDKQLIDDLLAEGHLNSFDRYIVMKRLEGYTDKEIARMIGVRSIQSVGNIRKKIGQRMENILDASKRCRDTAPTLHPIGG